jgi:hypothetical protein
VLKWLTQLVQDTSELLVVIFLAWFAIDFKNRVFAWIASHLLRHGCVGVLACMDCLRWPASLACLRAVLPPLAGWPAACTPGRFPG